MASLVLRTERTLCRLQSQVLLRGQGGLLCLSCGSRGNPAERICPQQRFTLKPVRGLWSLEGDLGGTSLCNVPKRTPTVMTPGRTSSRWYPPCGLRFRIGNHNSVEKAARMLARSKSVPLDIFVDFNDRYNRQGSISDVLTRAMNLLAPSIRRWKSFHLSVPNRPQANTELSHRVSEAPILRVFTVHVFHSMQEDVVSRPPDSLFGGYTPVLQTCSLKSFHLRWDHSILRNLQVVKFDGYLNGSKPSTAAQVYAS